MGCRKLRLMFPSYGESQARQPLTTRPKHPESLIPLPVVFRAPPGISDCPGAEAPTLCLWVMPPSLLCHLLLFASCKQSCVRLHLLWVLSPNFQSPKEQLDQPIDPWLGWAHRPSASWDQMTLPVNRALGFHRLPRFSGACHVQWWQVGVLSYSRAQRQVSQSETSQVLLPPILAFFP